MLTPVKMVCSHFTVFVGQNISRICQSHADEQKKCSWLQSFTRPTRHHFSGQWNPHYLWRLGCMESTAEPSNNILKLAGLVVHLFMQCLSSLMNKNQEKLCFFQLKPENKSTVYISNSNHFILAENS